MMYLEWKNNLSIKLQKMDISTTGIQIPIVPMDVDEERDPVMGGGEIILML